MTDETKRLVADADGRLLGPHRRFLCGVCGTETSFQPYPRHDGLGTSAYCPKAQGGCGRFQRVALQPRGEDA